MSSVPESWNRQADYTWREYFNPSFNIPHTGVVALARRLMDEFGKEKAYKILDEVASNLSKEYFSLFGKTNVESFQDALEVFGRMLELPEFKIAHETEVVELTDSKRVVNVKKCIWADAFQNMGAGDIGYIWTCKPDYLLASHIHPNFRLLRTKTLMQGYDCCNFTWYWEEYE